MSKHNDGFSIYTASKKPWRLRYFELFYSRTEALKREKDIKKQKSRVLLESLIKHWSAIKNFG
jgi:putative endonuclease